jgi:hypothetical protein
LRPKEIDIMKEKLLIQVCFLIFIIGITLSSNIYGQNSKSVEIVLNFPNMDDKMIEKIMVEIDIDSNLNFTEAENVLNVQKEENKVLIQTNSSSLKVYINEKYSNFIIYNINSFDSNRLIINGLSFYQVSNDSLYYISNSRCKEFCTKEILIDKNIGFKCDSCGFSEIENYFIRNDVAFNKVLEVNKKQNIISPFINKSISKISYNDGLNEKKNRYEYSIIYYLNVKQFL